MAGNKLTKAQEEKIRNYCDRMNLMEEDATYFVNLLADELSIARKEERERIIRKWKKTKKDLIEEQQMSRQYIEIERVQKEDKDSHSFHLGKNTGIDISIYRIEGAIISKLSKQLNE